MRSEDEVVRYLSDSIELFREHLVKRRA